MKQETITLTTPVTQGSKELNQVDIREPNTGALRGLDNFSVMRMDVNAHRILLPRISNLTTEGYDQLSFSDLCAVQQAVVGFSMN